MILSGLKTLLETGEHADHARLAALLAGGGGGVVMPAGRTKPAVLMEGIGLGESPRWHEGRLWFSDWVAHEVIALDPDGR